MSHERGPSALWVSELIRWLRSPARGGSFVAVGDFQCEPSTLADALEQFVQSATGTPYGWICNTPHDDGSARPGVYLRGPASGPEQGRSVFTFALGSLGTQRPPCAHARPLYLAPNDSPASPPSAGAATPRVVGGSDATLRYGHESGGVIDVDAEPWRCKCGEVFPNAGAWLAHARPATPHAEGEPS